MWYIIIDGAELGICPFINNTLLQLAEKNQQIRRTNSEVCFKIT